MNKYMRRTRSRASVILIISLLVISTEAFAVTGARLLYNETDTGNGLWQYDYTFYNTSGPDGSLFSIWFDFSRVSTVTGSPLPAGWDGTLWNGTHTTSWINAFSNSPVYDITAGSHQDGFGFTLDHRAGDISYTAYFIGQEGTVHTSGLTAVAPEPSSYLLIITGWAFLVLRRQFRFL